MLRSINDGRMSGESSSCELVAWRHVPLALDIIHNGAEVEEVSVPIN